MIYRLDGEQHFEQVAKWDAPEIVSKRDMIKTHTILNQNKRLIRIFQKNVYENTIDWHTLLKDAIFADKSDEIIYISKDTSLYDKHKHRVKFDKVINHLNQTYLN